MFPFLKYKKYYFVFSGILIAGSILLLIYYGINFGIDFVGGSMIRYEYKEARPAIPEIASKMAVTGLENFSLREMGERGVIIKVKDISEQVKINLHNSLSQDETVDISSWNFEKVGGVIGRETTEKAFIAIGLSVLAIIIYVAWAFRRIAGIIRSWEYGIVTIIALVHDMIISFGAVVLMGKFLGSEFSVPILTALLTILGYSVNDTIVVFDRVRENLLKSRGSFDEIIDESLNQTFARSLNTSLTTMLALFAIFFLAGPVLKEFSLLLLVGIFFGVYSSIFIASPLVVLWFNKKQKGKIVDKKI